MLVLKIDTKIMNQSYIHIFHHFDISGLQVEELRRRFGWAVPPTLIEGTGLSVKDLRLMLADSAKRPLVGGMFNYVLLNADAISPEVANTLLKSIEEPPEYLSWHLVTTNEAKVLTTIVSRCVRIRYGALVTAATSEIENWEGKSLVEKLKWAEELASDEAAVARLTAWQSNARVKKDWLWARSLEELVGKLKKTGANKRLHLENFVLQHYNS